MFDIVKSKTLCCEKVGVELQTLWLADKVRNILNDEPQADEVLKILETDFK